MACASVLWLFYSVERILANEPLVLLSLQKLNVVGTHENVLSNLMSFIWVLTGLVKIILVSTHDIRF